MAYVSIEQNSPWTETILVDPDVFIRTKKNKYRGSRVVNVAIPVVAYRYEVKTNNYHEDFLHEAVFNLADYYIKNEKGKDFDFAGAISKDLGLSISLVKAMLKEKALMQSVLEEDNGKSRSQYTNNFIILYDEIRETFIERVISLDTFESMKDECEDFSKYRPSIGDSSRYFIHKLSVPDSMRKKAWKEPAQEDVSALLRQRALKYRKLDNATLSIKYTGISEEFYLISSIYYDKNNAVTYCGENPFGPGRAGWIVSDAEIYSQGDFKNSKKLTDSLSKMEDSVDVDSFKSSERHDSLYNMCMEYFEDIYGKKELNATGELKERLVATLSEYSKMVHFCQNSEIAELEDRIADAKRSYYIAVADLYEFILAHAFLKNYKECNHKQYSSLIENMDTSNYSIGEYWRLATNVGFDKNQLDKKVRINKRQISYAVRNQKDSLDWYLMIFACLMEAEFDESHPMFTLAAEYPDFFGYIRELEKLRDPSKHGSRDELRWNNYDYQQLAIFMFNIFILEPKDNKFVDSNHFVNHEGIEEEYQQIDNAAADTLRKFEHLCLNIDAYNAALALEREYVSKGRDYYSKAYNLLDEVMKQLIYCVSGNENEIDRTYVNKVIGYRNYDKEDIAKKTESILETYDCNYKFKKRRNAPNFVNATYSSKLSYGNRIYYFIIIADHRVPNFLRRFLNENGTWLGLMEHIEEKRGHSDITDFSDDAISSVHKNVLKLTDKIVSYIDEFEEDRE